MFEDHGLVRTEPTRSPLDPFLRQFLQFVAALPNGYLPASDRRALTALHGWQVEFADALLTSAQARGMIERKPIGRGRKRSNWRVTTRGRIWLEMADVLVTMPISAELDQATSHPMA